MDQVPLNYPGFFAHVYNPYNYVSWDNSSQNVFNWQLYCRQLQNRIQLLENENIKLKEQKSLLEQQSVRLLDQNGVPIQMTKARRPYKKRSKQLKKNLRCPYQGCESKYSSRIALNSHLRKKHRRRQTIV